MRKAVADVLKVVDKHLESFIVVDKDDALQFLERLAREISKRLDKVEAELTQEDDPRLEWIFQLMKKEETDNG